MNVKNVQKLILNGKIQPQILQEGAKSIYIVDELRDMIRNLLYLIKREA